MKTSIHQVENRADVETTAEICRQVVDANLSVDEPNVKVMTLDGRVTLRGPVQTVEEKSRVAAIARKVAGPRKVRRPTGNRRRTLTVAVSPPF